MWTSQIPDDIDHSILHGPSAAGCSQAQHLKNEAVQPGLRFNGQQGANKDKSVSGSHQQPQRANDYCSHMEENASRLPCCLKLCKHTTGVLLAPNDASLRHPAPQTTAPHHRESRDKLNEVCLAKNSNEKVCCVHKVSVLSRQWVARMLSRRPLDFFCLFKMTPLFLQCICVWLSNWKVFS